MFISQQYYSFYKPTKLAAERAKAEPLEPAWRNAVENKLLSHTRRRRY